MKMQCGSTEDNNIEAYEVTPEKNENELHLRYNVDISEYTRDEHTIDGEYFNIISTNQVTIETKGAPESEPIPQTPIHVVENANHTLIDGICVKCLNSRVEKNTEDIAKLKAKHDNIVGTKEILNSTSEQEIDLADPELKYIYFKATDYPIVYNLKFSADDFKASTFINRIIMIVDGTSAVVEGNTNDEISNEILSKDNIYTFKIPTIGQFTINVKKGYNYIYELTWVGQMNRFFIEKVTEINEPKNTIVETA